MNIKAIIKKNQGVVFCYLIALVLFAGFSVYMPGFARLSHIRTVFLESALIGIVDRHWLLSQEASIFL